VRSVMSWNRPSSSGEYSRRRRPNQYVIWSGSRPFAVHASRAVLRSSMDIATARASCRGVPVHRVVAGRVVVEQGLPSPAPISSQRSAGRDSPASCRTRLEAPPRRPAATGPQRNPRHVLAPTLVDPSCFAASFSMQAGLGGRGKRRPQAQHDNAYRSLELHCVSSSPRHYSSLLTSRESGDREVVRWRPPPALARSRLT